MSYKVLLQKTAIKEFEDITKYLSRNDRKAALLFKRDWYTAIESLRDGVVSYRLSRFDQLSEAGYHSLILNNYVLLYLEEENVRTVAHVFHQSQDYSNLV